MGKRSALFEAEFVAGSHKVTFKRMVWEIGGPEPPGTDLHPCMLAMVSE